VKPPTQKLMNKLPKDNNDQLPTVSPKVVINAILLVYFLGLHIGMLSLMYLVLHRLLIF